MTTVPAILICTNAVKDDCNRVFDATGRGPTTFSRAMVAADDDTATYLSTPTHWLAQDMSATDDSTITWLAMTDGDLPQISGVWGEGGVISAADAMAACGGGNLNVYSAGGLLDETAVLAWRNSVIAGAGLKFRPDEPI